MDKDEKNNLEKFLKLRNVVKINLLDCFEKIDKEVDNDGEMILFYMISELIQPLFGIQKNLKDMYFTKNHLMECIQEISEEKLIKLTKKNDEENESYSSAERMG
jgi:hypothetical protein